MNSSMINEHKQFQLPDHVPDHASQVAKDKTATVVPFELSASNINRTDKDLNIKNLHRVTDVETVINHGQKFKNRSFSTLVTGSVHSISANDFLVGCTSLSYAPQIGLPLPSLVGAGKHFIIKDEIGGAATTTITITSAGEKNIDGSSSTTITTNYGAKHFYSDGANWFTI